MRVRHHGLRPAGGDRRAGRAPGQDHGVRQRRRLHPDEHPGTGHRRAAPHAGEGRAVQQRLDGHGAAVAGARPRQPLQPELQRGHARFLDGGARLRLAGGPRRPPCRSRRGPGRVPALRRALLTRRARQRRGELLPDDSRRLRGTKEVLLAIAPCGMRTACPGAARPPGKAERHRAPGLRGGAWVPGVIAQAAPPPAARPTPPP